MSNRYHEFLQQHRLPADYIGWAHGHFRPVIQVLGQADAPQLLGINGCQGSGKSTLAAFLALALKIEQGARVVCLSMDDFYYPRAKRAQLARDIHPLLATRGVPGTHDVTLAQHTLSNLLSGKKTAIPRFDKGLDDRLPSDCWQATDGRVDIILLEGWCLGAQAQPEAALAQPVNALEAREDPEGIWRRYVNRALAEDYPRWFAQVQRWLMLKAPDFRTVLQWRWQQEQKLADALQKTPAQSPHTKPPGLMDYAQTERFVQHYQRLTEHQLASLPAQMDHLYELNAQRQIVYER